MSQAPVGESPEQLTESLTPFLVEFDHAQLFERFPQLEDVVGVDMKVLLIQELFSDGTSSRLRNEINEVMRELEPSVSRAERRSIPESYKNDLNSLVAAAGIYLGHMVLDYVSTDERQQKTREILEATAANPAYITTPAGRKFINGLPNLSAAIHEFIWGVNEHKDSVQDEVFGQIEGNPAAEYEFLKLLLTVESEQLHEDAHLDLQRAHDLQALQWLNLLVHTADTPTGSKVTKLLGEHLDKGVYDRFIARDLLGWEASKAGSGLPEEKLVGMTALVGLVELASGVTLDTEGLERLADSIHIWPREYTRPVVKGKEDLQYQLNHIKRAVWDLAGNAIRREDFDYEAALSNILDKIIEYVARRNPSLFKHIGTRAIEQANNGGTDTSEVKRRRLGRVKQSEEDETPAGSPELESAPSFTLVHFDTNGDFHSQGSDKFKKMVNEFLETHKNTPGLEEDVNKILEYMSSPTYVNGRIAGAKPAKKHKRVKLLVDGEPKELITYELKPTETPGLSLKTELGRQSRTVFCYAGDHVLAIGGIIYRGHLDRLLAKIHKK